MRTRHFVIISAVISVISLFMLSSCSEDLTIMYNDIEMGDIISGRFVNDAGITFTPVEQECEGQLDTMGRAIIRCDILKKVSATEYEIRLKEMSKVLKKDCLISDEVEDIDALGEDPALISQAWVSAGYLNIASQITFIQNSSKRHLLNLLYDKTRDNTDTLHFELRHNAYGECYPTTGMIDSGVVIPDGTSYSVGVAYASFPVMKFLPEGKDSIPIKIKYTWYVTVNDTITSDTYTKDVNGYLVKE